MLTEEGTAQIFSYKKENLQQHRKTNDNDSFMGAGMNDDKWHFQQHLKL